MNSFKALQSIAELSLVIGKLDRLNVKSLNNFADKALDELDLEDFLIYLANPVDKTLRQFAASRNKRSERGYILNELEIHYQNGIVGSVASNKRVERIANTKMDKRYIVDDESRYSELAVPIIKNDVVIGVLDSEHTAKNYFSECHVQAFTILGQLLIPALDKFRHSEQRNPNYYFSEFIRLLEEEKLYMDSSISLTKFSEIMNIHSSYLSKIINDESQLNFSSILNKYRVGEVKKMLVDEEYNSYGTLGIAFKAGFNSKAAFNRAFKKETSLSPSEYKCSYTA